MKVFHLLLFVQFINYPILAVAQPIHSIPERTDRFALAEIMSQVQRGLAEELTLQRHMTTV